MKFIEASGERMFLYSLVGAELSGMMNCFENLTLYNMVERNMPIFGSLREFSCWRLQCRPRCAVFGHREERAKAYSEVSDRFGFICNLTLTEVMEPR